MDHLLGTERAEKKRKKAKKAETFDPDGSLVLPVGDEGASIVCKACSKANDDLHLLYTESNMNPFFCYLQQVGISISSAGEGSKRSYTKTGQYSKKGNGSASEDE